MAKLSERTKIVVNTSSNAAYDPILDVEGVGLVRASDVVRELANRSLKRFRQQIKGHNSREIIVTENDGILPIEDNYIELNSPAGNVFQGEGLTEYTIDRTVEPNIIRLGQAPPGPLNYLITFWI